MAHAPEKTKGDRILSRHQRRGERIIKYTKEQITNKEIEIAKESLYVPWQSNRVCFPFQERVVSFPYFFIMNLKAGSERHQRDPPSPLPFPQPSNLPSYALMSWLGPPFSVLFVHIESTLSYLSRTHRTFARIRECKWDPQWYHCMADSNPVSLSLFRSLIGTIKPETKEKLIWLNSRSVLDRAT